MALRRRKGGKYILLEDEGEKEVQGRRERSSITHIRSGRMMGENNGITGDG